MTIRYTTSSPLDSIPDIGSGKDTLEPSAANKIRQFRRNHYVVIQEVAKKMSDTSMAKDCFVKRKNSRKFQDFMFNYAYIMTRSTTLSGEL